jgi:Mn2+/Fe2+ NRAMP family transporter
MMAFELAIIGVVTGIALGLRYKVLILVPAVLFVMILAIVIGIARADGVWSIVLATVVVVTAVQLGYSGRRRDTRNNCSNFPPTERRPQFRPRPQF